MLMNISLMNYFHLWYIKLHFSGGNQFTGQNPELWISIGLGLQQSQIRNISQNENHLKSIQKQDFKERLETLNFSQILLTNYYLQKKQPTLFVRNLLLATDGNLKTLSNMSLIVCFCGISNGDRRGTTLSRWKV